jgi:hypothetical protein
VKLTDFSVVLASSYWIVIRPICLPFGKTHNKLCGCDGCLVTYNVGYKQHPLIMPQSVQGPLGQICSCMFIFLISSLSDF